MHFIIESRKGQVATYNRKDVRQDLKDGIIDNQEAGRQMRQRGFVKTRDKSFTININTDMWKGRNYGSQTQSFIHKASHFDYYDGKTGFIKNTGTLHPGKKGGTGINNAWVFAKFVYRSK